MKPKRTSAVNTVLINTVVGTFDNHGGRVGDAIVRCVSAVAEIKLNRSSLSVTSRPAAPRVYQQMSETFELDEAVRDRLASPNPTAAAILAGRPIETQERQYGDPDQADFDALRCAGNDLVDYVEGVAGGAAA